MKFFAIFLSILVFAAGVVFGKTNNIGTYFADKNAAPVNDEVNKVENNNAGFISVTSQITPSISAVDAVTPTPLQSDKFANFRYPDSEIVKDTQDQIVMTSSAEIDRITDWYKNRITAKKYNLNTFVVTKTNGNEVDKLSATGIDGSVSVEIVKESESKLVSITVSFK